MKGLNIKETLFVSKGEKQKDEVKTVQKQSFTDVLQNRRSQKLWKPDRKAAGYQAFNLIKNTIIHMKKSLKRSLLMQSQSNILTSTKIMLMKILNLRLLITSKYWNIKTCSHWVTFQIGAKKILWLKC